MKDPLKKLPKGTVEWFAEICNQSQIRQIYKEERKGGEILIGDGHFPFGRIEHAPAHYMTLWAWKRDETVVAKPLYFDLEVEIDGEMIDNRSTRKERVRQALEDARAFVEMKVPEVPFGRA